MLDIDLGTGQGNVSSDDYGGEKTDVDNCDDEDDGRWKTKPPPTRSDKLCPFKKIIYAIRKYMYSLGTSVHRKVLKAVLNGRLK